MKYSKINIRLGLASLALLALASCSSDANSPGVEYMPDMYRSPSIEPYVDYQNPDQMSARLPVEGTIVFTANADEEYYYYPYNFENSFEGYELAGEGLVSPIAFTEETVAEGEIIYQRFCTHCHGKTGQGDGAIPSKADYPPPPPYNGNALKNLPEGKMYHTLTFGKGMMGSHASQLDQKERWMVIQYVKYLQNGESMSKTTEETTVQ
jgi:mono/diheme cytochrome c family protein